MILPVINAALDGAVFTINKILLSYSPPLLLVTLRLLIAGAILFIYQFIRFPQKLKLSAPVWVNIFKIALFFLAANALRLWSADYLTSTKAALLANMGPFISYGLALLLLGEKLQWLKVAGLMVGFTGCIPAMSMNSGASSAVKFAGDFPIAEMAAIISVGCYCYTWLLIQRTLNQRNTSVVSLNAFSMLIGGVLAFAMSVGKESYTELSFDTSFYYWLGAAIVISHLICVNLSSWLLKRYSITLLSLVALTTPIFAGITDLLWFGTPLTREFFMSAGLVAAGLSIFLYADHRQQQLAH